MRYEKRPIEELPEDGCRYTILRREGENYTAQSLGARINGKVVEEWPIVATHFVNPIPDSYEDICDLPRAGGAQRVRDFLASVHRSIREQYRGG